MASAPNLVGRSVVCSDLVRALDDAVEGRGSLVLLAGDAGIGKTALATHVAEVAQGRGVPVAWGRCAGGPGLPALWPWTEVLRRIGRLEGDGGHFGEGLGSDDGSIEGAAGRFRLFDQLITSLGSVADAGGLVVVLDDLHDADRDTIKLLELVAGQLSGRHLLVVGTSRDVEGRDRLRGVLDRAHVIAVRGLGLEETAQLMREASSVPVDDEAAGTMYERTGGNPLFVLEISRLLSDRSSEGREASSPAALSPLGSVRKVIDRRLARLSQPTVAVLQLAALDIGPLRPWLLGAVLGDDDVQDRIVEAEAARVLVPDPEGAVRFAHGLFREVLVADLPVAVR